MLLSTALKEAPGEALSLILEQHDDGQVDSSVPIRWCISRETAKMIEEKGILDPQLVIVIEQGGQELRRYVVPLEQQMHWIQFSRPGENVIRATIMWPATDDDTSVKKVLTSKNDEGNYKAALVSTSQPKVEALDSQLSNLEDEEWELDAGEENIEEAMASIRARRDKLKASREEIKKFEPVQTHMRNNFSALSRIDYEFQLGVMVPDEMFAKEPPRWMQWLGTKYKYWNGAAKDQCDLRRRAIWTACTLPFYYAFWAVAGLVVLVVYAVVAVVKSALSLFFIVISLIGGVRNINYKPLFHPLDLNPDAVEWGNKPSFWWSKKVKHEYQTGGEYYTYEPRHPVFAVLNPPVVLVLGAVAFVLYLLLSRSLWETIVTIIGAIFVVVVVAIGVLASGAIADKKAARAKQREREEKEAKERQKETLRKELEQLACSTASREVKISALPKERRTVHLRFQAFKASVCKPFAR